MKNAAGYLSGPVMPSTTGGAPFINRKKQRFHWKINDALMKEDRFCWSTIPLKSCSIGEKISGRKRAPAVSEKELYWFRQITLQPFFSLPLSHSLSHARTRSLLQYNSLFTHIDLSHSLSLHIETCTYTLKNTNRYPIHISSQPSVCTCTHTQTNTFIPINTHSLPHTILLFSLYLHSSPHNILTLSNSWCNLKRP